MAGKSWRNGMAPAHAMAFLYQKPSTKNANIHTSRTALYSERGNASTGVLPVVPDFLVLNAGTTGVLAI